jgi:hypothetical protein
MTKGDRDARASELLGALLIGAAVLSWAHLSAPTFYDGMDWLQLHLPAHQYMSAALRSGRLPLWNPYVALGRPFLADVETAVFYPPNLLYVLLDPVIAYAILSALHYALAAWGTRRLCLFLGVASGPSWLCATLFAASQALVARLQSGQSHYVAALAYLPLLILLTARLAEKTTAARVLGLAVALALQFLCGHPQVPWISWLALGAFVLGTYGSGAERGKTMAIALGGLALALIAGLALAAPTLLPFLEMVSQGNRLVRSLESCGRDAMGPFRWSSLVVPNGAQRAFYWEHDLYTGVCVLVGGVAGLSSSARTPQLRGLVTMAGVGALFASGLNTPAFALFYHLVPGTSVFRGPARGAVLVVLALVCGLGLLLTASARAQRATTGLAVGLGLALSLVAAHRAFAPPGITPTPWGERLFWLAAAACVLGMAALAPSAAVRRGALLATAALATLDLARASPPAKTAWVFPVLRDAERPLRDLLAQRGLYEPSGTPPRIAVPPTGVRENAGVFYGWSNFGGYQAVSLARVWEYAHAALGIPPSTETTFVSESIYERGPFPYDSMNLVVGVDPATGRFTGRYDADPRAYVATAARVVGGWREAIAAMRDGHDFHHVALVEPGVPLSLPESPPAGVFANASIVSFAPEHIVVESRSRAPGLLVLAEPWYPGWAAWVDGIPAPCFPVNAWMRATVVPPGTRLVSFRFRSRLLGWGLATSASSLLALLLWARGARVRGAGRPDAGRNP